MKLPAYEIPEEDADLWHCGKVISRRLADVYPSPTGYLECPQCGKRWRRVGLEVKVYCSTPCADRAAQARYRAKLKAKP